MSGNTTFSAIVPVYRNAASLPDLIEALAGVQRTI